MTFIYTFYDWFTNGDLYDDLRDNGLLLYLFLVFIGTSWLISYIYYRVLNQTSTRFSEPRHWFKTMLLNSFLISLIHFTTCLVKAAGRQPQYDGSTSFYFDQGWFTFLLFAGKVFLIAPLFFLLFSLLFKGKSNNARRTPF